MDENYDVEIHGTWVDRCINGTEQPSNIDDYIHLWHYDEVSDKSLMNYLGMTKEEYLEFLFDVDSVDKIIKKRIDTQK
jgi:hypothetical protein